MVPLRILCISDTHLGHLERDPVRAKDSYIALKEILDIAKDKRVDIILHAGDMFDGSVNPEIAVRTIKMLKLYHIPLVYIHGNHDSPMKFRSSLLPLIEASGFGVGIGKENITEYIPNGLGQVETWYHLYPFVFKNTDHTIYVYGIGYRKPAEINDVLMNKRLIIEGRFDSAYKILLIHQDLTDHEEPAIPRDFIRSQFDSIIYGHEHSHFVKRAPKEIRPGAPFPLTIAKVEMHERGVGLLELEDKGVKFEDIPLKTSRTVEMQSFSLKHGDDPAKRVEEEYAKFAKERKEHSRKPLVRLVVYYNRDQKDFLPDVNELRKKYPIRSANSDTIVYKRTETELKIVDTGIKRVEVPFRDILKEKLKEVDSRSVVMNSEFVMDMFDTFIGEEKKGLKRPRDVVGEMVKRKIDDALGDSQLVEEMKKLSETKV